VSLPPALQQQGKFGLINGNSIFERSLSKPNKLQLFAALAGSARACGNIEFSEKLFGYACKISRELYDDLSSSESSIATALGFTILGNAASATNRRKGKFYVRASPPHTHLYPPAAYHLPLSPSKRFQSPGPLASQLKRMISPPSR